MRFRFGLPEGYALNLPVGKHISLKCVDKDGNTVMRQYTPTTGQETVGYFDLIIKIYPNGVMGNYLKNLPLNNEVEIRGPNGLLEYYGNGKIEYRPISSSKTAKKTISKIGMIAGGSGITPMLQVASAISHDKSDSTPVSLIFCNQTEGDIMCRDLLDTLKQSHDQFSLYYVVTRTENTDWKGGVGFVNQEMIKANLPAPADDVLIMLCGPPPMIAAMSNHLSEMGYTNDMITCF